jgi:hypothetical protein
MVRKGLFMVFVILCAAILTGCVAARHAGEFSNEAWRRTRHLQDWEMVKERDSAEGYEFFIAAYPQSEFQQEARSRLHAARVREERKAFEQAQGEDTIQAYESFIVKHQTGDLSAVAREKVKSMRAVFRKTRSLHVIAECTWLASVDRFPGTPAATVGTVPAKNHPARKNVVEAWIRELLISELRRLGYDVREDRHDAEGVLVATYKEEINVPLDLFGGSLGSPEVWVDLRLELNNAKIGRGTVSVKAESVKRLPGDVAIGAAPSDEVAQAVRKQLRAAWPPDE